MNLLYCSATIPRLRALSQPLKVMKLICLLLTVAMLQTYATGYSQVTLFLKNVRVEKVLLEVERQAGFDLLYTKKTLADLPLVTIDVKNASVQEVLRQCFKDLPVDFFLDDKTIVITRRPVEVGTSSRVVLLAPPVDLHGRIVSESGEPLEAVSITVRGSSKGTSSNASGYFTLTNVSDESVLAISSVGFEAIEISVARLKALTTEAPFNAAGGTIRKTTSGTFIVELKPTVAQLKDIVVIPYGTQQRSDYTGSVVTVSDKELAGRPRASFQESLQGNVPGLQSTIGTGQPGAAGNVRIRGTGSINAGSTPLYVVDGVPVNDMQATVLAFSSNPMAAINPNDIESVTVLKDAAATSIYGSRAANGVIMITTKSGAAGKTRINASVQHGFTEMVVNDRNRTLNTSEMTELLVEGVINSQSSGLIGITTPEAAYDFLVSQGLKPNIDTDWLDVILQKGQLRQYDLSASGGSATNSFFASLGYYKQDAVTRGQGYERATARLRMKNKGLERLTINAGLAPSMQKLSTIANAGTGANPIRSLYRLVPWTRPYNEDGSYSSIAYNPEIVRRENVYDTRIYSLMGDFGAELKLMPNLVIESKAAADVSFTNDYRYWSPLWVDGKAANGRGAEYTTTMINWNITNLLKYHGEVGRLKYSATLGQEANKKTRKRISTQADGYAREGLYSLASASKPFVAWSDQAETSMASYFLNTNFGFDSRFNLNLTGRIDGSSMFGRNVRYARFGSIGASWNLHREEFLKDLIFINELRLRASYGINGNLYNEWYGVDGLYSTTAVYNGAPGYLLSQLENQMLTWEKNKPFDIGVDFSLFNRRLSGSFDYYKRLTTDLLLNAGISATNGVPSQNRNIGSMENYGIELLLNSQNIVAPQADGFSWSTSFNISTGRNIITALGGVNQMISGVYNREIGGDFYQFYMKEWAGVDPETGVGLWFADTDRKTATTDYDSAVNLNQGAARPDFFGGLTNTFSYKRFSLSFMAYFSWGGQLYDNWGTYTSSDGSAGVSDYGIISRVDYENRWRKPGDIASSPKIVYGGSQTGTASQASSRFLYDASYIRLRDITLSYSIPPNKLIQNARVYARANNLFTYVKDDRLRQDPETFVGGILNQNLPIARQLLLGVDISL